ncbi:BamA/TamA family outer membrane protein [Vacuolonema iberomarrocanum]|uniref:BamA/TamA family outer membrane protein n=1 Tax=Vacuolonema iberomarrocanum TaxID=3454632 RepID=UPI003F6DE332
MNVKKIWLSPVLLAILTLSALLGVAPSARAETESEVEAEAGVDSPAASSENLEVTEPNVAVAPTESSSVADSDKIRPLLGEDVETAIAPSTPAVPAFNPTARVDVAVAAAVERREPAATSVRTDDDEAKVRSLLGEATQGTPSVAPLPLAQQEVPEEPPTFLTPEDLPPEATEEVPTEPRVLVAEVAISGAPPELEDQIFRAINTRPGQTTSRTQLQQDVNAIFATGFFAEAQAIPEDTPLGVRITFLVETNPVLQDVALVNSEVVPPETVDEIFGEQYGEILNLNELQDNIEELNAWYQENGYVLAQVIDIPEVQDDGTVQIAVAEGEIEDIEIQFVGDDGEPFDEDGEPIEGRTRDFIITRQFESQPGDIFNQQQIETDLRRAFGLGIFDDLQIALSPGDDPSRVDVTVIVDEGQTGSIAAGVGVSSASGLFGTVSYQERNFGGNNQQLAAEFQLGERDLLFDVSFTDPWIATDPNRTSYTVNAFSRRSIPLVFQGGEDEVFLPNGDRPRVRRFGGGIAFGRPIDESWTGSVGIRYQNIRLQDSDGDLSPEDEFGNDLSFSEDGTDDLLLLQVSATNDQRNSPLTPTSGSFLRLSTEQSVPIGDASIFMNRLRASYSYFIPVDFTDFNEGPETLALNLQGGVILGDLPPYEAFSLGGTDSVRGYDAGDVGSGRAFVLGSAEYRFPLFSILGGVLFVDFGTDLGTGSDVPGEPAEIRDKPGTGFGYGVGLRVQSPIGAVRVDYGFNDEGDGRLHFGIGERF